MATEGKSREALEACYGRVWSTEQLRKEFVVDSWCAPWVFVTTHDGVRGSLEFQPEPRFYFNLILDR